MARSKAKERRTSARGGGTVRLFFAFLLGIVITLTGIVLYFYAGKPPVSATEKAAPWEPLLNVPIHASARAAAKSAPFPSSEDVFEAGARTYRAQCAQCHGVPGHEAPLGRTMLPHAQQFFSPRDRASTVAEAPGELYWKTAFGLRRSGMPAYNRALSDTELWQLALLLHSANDLPDPVRTLLTEGMPLPQPTVVQP